MVRVQRIRAEKSCCEHKMKHVLHEQGMRTFLHFFIIHPWEKFYQNRDVCGEKKCS